MKILFAGGGTGGHFYPLMAVANALNIIAEQEKITKLEMVMMADEPYDQNLLLQEGVVFKKVYAGKIRRYFSLFNITDMFKTAAGIIKALLNIYTDFPDVIFSKGGYASLPAVVAAKIFRIPLIIHESDAIPGMVNQWSGKFAKRVAISFSETAKFFPKEKTALIGNPIRKDLLNIPKTNVKDFFGLEENMPVVMVIGGSQGAKKINDSLLGVLPELIKKIQIIHICGKKNFKEIKGISSLILEKSEYKSRYHLFPFMDISLLKTSYGAADMAVSRAGSGSIFEIANAGLPSILIPIANSAQDHQRKNAYIYTSNKAGNVIEEENLSPHLLQSEIEIMLSDKTKMKEMGEEAKKFSKPDAAEKIAREIISLALEHA